MLRCAICHVPKSHPSGCCHVPAQALLTRQFLAMTSPGASIAVGHQAGDDDTVEFPTWQSYE